MKAIIRKQEKEIARAIRMDSLKIPMRTDYRCVSGLTREAVEKFDRVRPATLGDARKIQGMTPAAVQNLALYLEIQRKKGGRSASVSRETPPDDIRSLP